LKKITLIALIGLIIAGVGVNAQTTYQNLTREKAVIAEQLPIRDLRKTAVWFNMGWNGLTGFGVNLSYYPVPKIAIDAGIGLSAVGVKTSARGRYLFKVKNFTPFVGLGLMYGFGSPYEIEQKDSFNNDAPYKMKVGKSPFIQLAFGFEYMAKKGFYTLFNTGYALLLADNYEITSGTISPDMKRSLDISFGSGIVIEGGIGFAF